MYQYPIPAYDYTVINMSLLCCCQLQGGKEVLQESLGSCLSKDKVDRNMYFIINITFPHQLQIYFPVAAPPEDFTLKLTDTEQWFSVSLQDFTNLANLFKRPQYLKHLQQDFFQQDWSFTKLIGNADKYFLETIYRLNFVTLVVAIIISIILIYFIAEHDRLKALVMGLTINKTHQVEAIVSTDKECDLIWYINLIIGLIWELYFILYLTKSEQWDNSKGTTCKHSMYVYVFDWYTTLCSYKSNDSDRQSQWYHNQRSPTEKSDTHS